MSYIKMLLDNYSTKVSIEATDEDNGEENKKEEEEGDVNSPDSDSTDEEGDNNDSDDSVDDNASDVGDSGDTDNPDADDADKELSPEEFRKENEVIEPERDKQEEVRVDEPDDEKVKIKAYLEPIIGDDIDELTLYSAQEVNRPLYHISMNPNITRFVPQVSKRTLSKENRSIPRVSTSTSLIGCFNGYQSLVSDMDGRTAKNFSGIFKVYNLPYQYAVKPSKQLLPDGVYSDEYWLVSWKKETYAIHPSVTAEFTVPKIEKVYGNDGSNETYHLYVKVINGSLYLDHQKRLEPGYYYIQLHGYNYHYPLDDNDNIEIETIDESEYRKVTAMSMMVKKKESR